jgi:hypothetical protein
MKAKASRMVAVVLLAVSMCLAAVPAFAGSGDAGLAAEMGSAAQLCVGDGGGSGGG